MVGRAVELARLRELAARVGDPAVVLVTGEAGIGKTRLVSELVATLDPSTPVLAGQGSQGAPGRPFQLLLEAVEPLVEAWDAAPVRLAAREEALRLLLGSVAPKLAAHAEREYGPGGAAPHRGRPGPRTGRLGGVLRTPARCPGRSGRACVRGPALGRRREHRLAVTPALPAAGRDLRPEGVDRRHPLVELLADLERQRSVTTIALDRLSRAGVAELLAAVYRNRSWCVSACRR
jgi:hypothetical protein